MSHKTVYITGGRGFLGSHISDYCSTHGWKVLDYAGQHSNALPLLKKREEEPLPNDTFPKYLELHKPDLLVHCAGTSLVSSTFEDPGGSFRNTVPLTSFVLEAIRNYSPGTHLIFLSSISVCGNPDNVPTDESAQIAPVSPYGAYKAMCELMIEQYRQHFGLSASTLRIFSAYGPRLRKQVLWDLCHKALQRDASSLEVWGAPEDTRDFIHAQDVAQAVELCGEQRASDTFHLGSGGETPIQEVAQMIVSHIAPEKEVRFTEKTMAGYPSRWLADISKLSTIGFAPTMGIAEGIEEYCRWFLHIQERADVSL